MGNFKKKYAIVNTEKLSEKFGKLLAVPELKERPADKVQITRSIVNASKTLIEAYCFPDRVSDSLCVAIAREIDKVVVKGHNPELLPSSSMQHLADLYSIYHVFKGEHYVPGMIYKSAKNPKKELLPGNLL